MKQFALNIASQTNWTITIPWSSTIDFLEHKTQEQDQTHKEITRILPEKQALESVSKVKLRLQ